MGDTDYDCNYCHGKNHLAKECMLQRLNEKKEGEDDEAYYMQKLEQIKKKKNTNKSMNDLIMQKNDDENEFGGVEVWSTDSEDDDVRRPTHGKVFVAKEESSQFIGRCLMVTDELSQLHGYATDGEEEMIVVSQQG